MQGSPWIAILLGRSFLPVLALFLLGVPRGAEAGRHPHDRNGFMIGFGVGGGSAGVDLQGTDDEEREGSGTGNFRIVWAVRPDLVLGLEASGWTKEFEESFGDVTWTFSTAVAAFTYYPPGSGLFLRGGIGIGTAEVEVEDEGVTISGDESGLGLLAALGYEWRLTRKFALAPQVEFTYQDEGGDLLESTNVVSGTLGFNWYW